MQMKATVRYGFTPQSSTIVPDNNCWPGSEKSAVSYNARTNINGVANCKQVGSFLKCLFTELPQILQLTPEININCHATVHGSTIQRDQSRKNLNPPKVMNG